MSDLGGRAPSRTSEAGAWLRRRSSCRPVVHRSAQRRACPAALPGRTCPARRPARAATAWAPGAHRPMGPAGRSARPQGGSPAHRRDATRHGRASTTEFRRTAGGAGRDRPRHPRSRHVRGSPGPGGPGVPLHARRRALSAAADPSGRPEFPRSAVGGRPFLSAAVRTACHCGRAANAQNEARAEPSCGVAGGGLRCVLHGLSLRIVRNAPQRASRAQLG